MELRNKLLLYFIALVILTLAAFGFSIYQIARDDTLRKDKELLETLVKTEVDEISEEYQASHSLDHLIKHFSGQRSDDHVWLLIDQNGQPVIPLEKNNESDQFISPEQILKIITASENSGYHTANDRLHFWAKAIVEGSSYTAIHIYTPKYSANDYYNKLTTRLIVVAMIILWIAVWASLIISTVITRRIKEQQNRIEYQASHDVLTGLQNRQYLAKKIDTVLESNNNSSLAVVIIGINRFREINDTLGHEFGDSLLIEFGNHLKSEFWSNDTIARIGSGQYALLLPLTEQSHWKIVIDKIEKILGNPFFIQDIQIITDVSIGISIHPDHGNTSADLLRSAEVAMRLAKKNGTLYECYNPERDPNSVERLKIMSELNYAINKKEFELHFQPKVDIKTQQIIGCEALLRWNNGNRGPIPPDVFIPLAEQSSFIKTLTRWVVEEAVKHCAYWHSTGKPISVAVNLSARLLIDEEVISMVAYSLVKHGLAAEHLILEITESAMMIDPARARSIIEKLRDMGVHLSIDDFGTGYTSISQIKNLPVSEIKIDKSFIFNLLTNASDERLVRLIIGMAHSMGHTVTAEGIETREILDQLQSMGCDTAQGYFISRPLPVDKFQSYLLQTG